MVRDLSEVRIGDPVVHEQHGIGRYLGLLTLDLGDGPTSSCSSTTPTTPSSTCRCRTCTSSAATAAPRRTAAPLHELGSGQWEKAKKKAAQQAHDTAAELLNLYAQRAARTGHAFELQAARLRSLRRRLRLRGDADQAAAIEAVINDMTSGKPMDRLVCGDVGFGKTEVALRAAFVALADGKQVAVLVPTTLLAEQHFQTFSDRFADWPVNIAELSRFRTGKETKAALEGLADGTIDIVIGTHKLLQADVKFKNLGLVIIDEEHRFGVRQKERLKRLRAEVDVLTLTATPIPRTLAMSLEGMRDFSVIATAPQRRLAIKTFVSRYSHGIIREAALRELKRGGQIYFLHNEVDTIATRAETLAKLLPEARIAVAHGQMAERELEQVMRDFYQQRINLLLCTTIIETGIDVPTANTIIINRADRFGLAQLHQLRGRVGRSHHQAYAYLLTPPGDALSAQAKKRLEAIQMMEDLGSGFYLAMHDLEIRGAGEVLGEVAVGRDAGSGLPALQRHAARVGVGVEVGREPDLNEPLGVTTEINLHVPALLPERYCADVHERLVLYKRLASAEDQDELDEHPGRARRPLRSHARPGAGAAREPSPAHARQAARRAQDRRRPRAHHDPVREAPAVRSGQADPPRAEGRPHPLRRTRSHAHRPCGARARGAHRARARLPGQARLTRSGRARSHPAMSARDVLPPQVRVIVRDWLSANHVVLRAPRRTTW